MRPTYPRAADALRLVALLASLAVAGLARGADVPQGPLPEGIEPLHYRLEFVADPTRDGFSGTTEIDIKIAAPVSSFYMHGLNLEVARAQARLADGRTVEARYRQVDETGVAELEFDGTLDAGAATLRLEYKARYGEKPAGLHRAMEDGRSFLFTQHEPIEARRTFPGFDEPRFKVPFDVSVTAPGGNLVVSNGAATRTEPGREGQVRTVFETTARLPTYLLFLGVGPFEVVDATPLPPNAIRKQAVPLRAVVLPGKGHMAKAMLDATPIMVEDLESYFGLPYPYTKLDLVVSPNFPGAMENAGAILYGETALLVGEGTSTEQLRGIAETHAHELAHQWFGNLVTPVWWDSLWLNESFASWMGKRVAHNWRPDLGIEISTTTESLGAMNIDSRPSARAIAEPVRRNHEIAGSFDAITYLKGGGVLAMFNRYLGKDAFREGVRLHMRRFADGNASTVDFMESLAKGSGQPETVAAFQSFVTQAGLPQLEASLDCSGKTPVVRLRQSRFLPLGARAGAEQQWRIPACIEYGGSAARQHCVMVDEPVEEIALDDSTQCPASLLPNAGGSGYYRFALDEAGWGRLMEELPRLDDASALVTANNLVAAFQAGTLPAPALVAGLERIAMLKSREAALNPYGTFLSLDQYLLAPAAQDGFRRWLSTLYRERFDALGYTSDSPQDRTNAVDAALWRGELGGVLVDIAHEPVVSAELAARAERLLAGASPGALQRDALDPGLLGSALIAGVRLRGAGFFDALLEDLLASNDSTFQQQAAFALGSTENDELAARVRTLALDPRINTTSVSVLLSGQAMLAGQHAALVTWLESNVDKLAARFDPLSLQRLPRFAGAACSSAEAERVRALFAPRAAKFGAERVLALTIEGIEMCTARKARYGEALNAHFADGQAQ